MRWRNILNVIGILILFLGVTMILPLICGYIYKDASVIPVLKSMVITIVAGLIMYFGFKRHGSSNISQREGMAIVALGWTGVGLFGALPFYFEGVAPYYADAFFESVSGFTTTGASILTNIEGASHGLLFWRSFIQWLGGMGNYRAFPGDSPIFRHRRYAAL